MFIRSIKLLQFLKRRPILSRLISSEEKLHINSDKIQNLVKQYSQPAFAFISVVGTVYYLGTTHATLNSEVKILNTKLMDEKEKAEKVAAAEKEKAAAEKREIEAKLENVKSVSEARIRELETQIRFLSSK